LSFIYLFFAEDADAVGFWAFSAFGDLCSLCVNRSTKNSRLTTGKAATIVWLFGLAASGSEIGGGTLNKISPTIREFCKNQKNKGYRLYKRSTYGKMHFVLNVVK